MRWKNDYVSQDMDRSGRKEGDGSKDSKDEGNS